jgi:alanyl-tRNA synthetase
VSNNYETDLIFPIIEKAAQLAGIDYHKSDALTQTALKVIGDHTRAVTYLMSDGVTPSNVGRGYIVRRLLRRWAEPGVPGALPCVMQQAVLPSLRPAA